MSGNQNTVVRATKSVNTLQGPVIVRGPTTLKQSSVVKKPVQKPQVPKSTSTTKPKTSSSISSTKVAVKRPAPTKSSIEKKSAPVVKKQKTTEEKEEVGDRCDIDEERSADEDDDGADLKGFILDEDEESDGVSEEEEAKAIEKDSFKSVDDYRSQMEEIKAMLGSQETRTKFMQSKKK